jgi:hypothetical protein
MAERDPAGTVLRLPMVYGPGDPLHRFYAVAKRIADGRRYIILPETFAATDQRAAGRIYNLCEEPSFSELEWARKTATAMHWTGEFVVLPDDRTPKHLLRSGNAAQHWTASSARIHRELDTRSRLAYMKRFNEQSNWSYGIHLHSPAWLSSTTQQRIPLFRFNKKEISLAVQNECVELLKYFFAATSTK